MKQVYLSILFVCVKVLITLPLTGQKVSVQDFRMGAEAEIIGENCFRLTEAYDWASGTVWYKNAISLAEPFEMEMAVNLGCKDADGADGMVFVFYPGEGAIGRAGEGMGFRGLVPSLGIEIDTWENEHLLDPPQDHIALLQHGQVGHYENLKGPIAIPNIETCGNNSFKITWEAATHQLRIYINGVERLHYQGNIVEEIFLGVPKVYWGVTAATGRYNNRQEICFEKLDFVPPLDHLEFHPRHAHELLSGEILPLQGAQYKTGKAELLKGSLPDLNRLVNLLKENPEMSIDIMGHTDNRGDAEANRQLSERRARAIADYLISKGIPTKRVTYRGLGELYPIRSNDTPEGRRHNRRVEIHVFKPRV